jgi:DNA-binding NtrC family response regulator
VRELENALERLTARFPGGLVSAVEVSEALGTRVAARDDLVCEPRMDIASALRNANGNVAAAARSLGVPRTTLRRRIANDGAAGDGQLTLPNMAGSTHPTRTRGTRTASESPPPPSAREG